MERTELPTKERIEELSLAGVRPFSSVALRALTTGALCAGFGVVATQVGTLFESIHTPIAPDILAERVFWIVVSPAFLALGAGVFGAFVHARGKPRFITIAPDVARFSLRWPAGSVMSEIVTLALATISLLLAVRFVGSEALSLIVRPLEQWPGAAHTLLDRTRTVVGVLSGVVAVGAGACAWLSFRWRHRMTRAEVIASEE